MMDMDKLLDRLNKVSLRECKGARESIKANHSSAISVSIREELLRFSENWEMASKFIPADDNRTESLMCKELAKDMSIESLRNLEALYTIKKYIDACQS